MALVLLFTPPIKKQKGQFSISANQSLMNGLSEWTGMQAIKKVGKREEGQEDNKKEMISGTLMMLTVLLREKENLKKEMTDFLIKVGRDIREIEEIVNSMIMANILALTKEEISTTIAKIQMTTIDR